MSGGIEGFTALAVPGDGIGIDLLVGGSGPPLLLLHGYPQTRMAWKGVALALREHFTLVIPDLRGYGRSDKPPGDGGPLYSNRQRARDQVAIMRALGFDRFSIAGHDRGGRVAYRLALDAPEAVERLAVLDIVPTAEVWRGDSAAAMELFHWSFLAQPTPVPEMLLEGRAEAFMRWLFERWARPGFAFDPEAMEDYLRCGSSAEAIHAACEDYRAGWSVDRVHDEEDRAAGRRIAAPTLVLWGSRGTADRAKPLDAWRRWAEHVDGEALPGGHFVPEEASVETARALLRFFSAGSYTRVSPSKPPP